MNPQKNALFAAMFAGAAIALTVIFPTVSATDSTINPFSEPVGIVAIKTDDPKVTFVGFVAGQSNDIENLPEAVGYNTVIELQAAFKQFLIANHVQVAVGEHGYGVKRLLDSMLGNQIIDLQLRQQIETVDLVGKLQTGNPSYNTLDAYAGAHSSISLPRPKLVIDRVARIAAIYTDHLDRLIQIGASPTAANVMPYKRPVQEAA